MGKKRDELDRATASKFAWRSAASVLAEHATADDPSSGLTTTASPAAGDADAIWSFTTCEGLVQAVDRAWVLADLDVQRRAVSALWSRAISLNIRSAGLANWRRASIRFARLFARYHSFLDPDVQNRGTALIGGLDFSHPEAGELVLDTLRADLPRLGSVLWTQLQRGPLPQLPTFAEQLGQLVDAGPTWQARRWALNFALLAKGDAIVPALKRALRAPHLGIRYRALQVLRLRGYPKITAVEVLWLLDDAVVHQPPHETDHDSSIVLEGYPLELETVTAMIRPMGGERALARIVHRECDGQGYRNHLTEGWALGVLAAAYPDAALTLIDRRLRAFFWIHRYDATLAAAKLPPAEARPRLLLAASDGSPRVSEAAADEWLKLFGAPCPVDETTAVQFILALPASERLRGRILALRGPEEARAKLLSVLLAEAPDREALAALMVALADDQISNPNDLPGPVLPRNRVAWCREIMARFGTEGARALCFLDQRYCFETTYGWLKSLAELVDQEPLANEACELIAAQAAATIEERDGSRLYAALIIARALGFPHRTHDSLWNIAMSPSEHLYTRDAASHALGLRGDPAWCKVVLRDAVVAALENGDLEAGIWPARALAEQRSPDSNGLVRDLLMLACERSALSNELTDRFATCARLLREQHELPPAWLASRLAEPETCGFAIAAKLCDAEMPAAIEALLRGALVSTARRGAAAAEAARVLLRHRELEQSLATQIFQSAPLQARADILFTLCTREVPLRPVWSALEELLLSNDEAVLLTVRSATCGLSRVGVASELRELLPRILDREAHEGVRQVLEMPEDSAECYWQTD